MCRLRQAAIVRPGPDRIEHLRADEQLLPRRRRLSPAAIPDAGFAAAAAVGVGGVEEIDAGIERAIHQRERLRLVLAHSEERRRRADAAEVAAAQPEPRHLQPGRSEAPVVHRVQRVHTTRTRGNMAPRRSNAMTLLMMLIGRDVVRGFGRRRRRSAARAAVASSTTRASAPIEPRSDVARRCRSRSRRRHLDRAMARAAKSGRAIWLDDVAAPPATRRGP